MTLENLNFIQKLPGLFLVKNSDSIFLNMTLDMAKLIGWKTVETSLGKTDYDVPCKAAEFASQYISLDKQVIESKKNLLSIESQYFADGWKTNLVKRNLFEDQNNPHTLLTQLIDITDTSLHRNCMAVGKLSKKGAPKAAIYTLSDHTQHSFNLSRRQEECLFFLIRGKTTKQIASILNLSPRTVEDYIDNIKIKFDCLSRHQLIDKAVHSNFFYYIPNSLMQKNLEELLN